MPRCTIQESPIFTEKFLLRGIVPLFSLFLGFIQILLLVYKGKGYVPPAHCMKNSLLTADRHMKCWQAPEIKAQPWLKCPKMIIW
jgi:hypothetical protein